MTTLTDTIESVYEANIDVEHPRYSTIDTKLKFKINLEVREWGIKEIWISVPDQKIEVYDTEKEEIVEIEIKDVEIDHILKDTDQITLHHLDFDGEKWTAY